MNLKKKLLQKQIEDIEHDLLSKEAYVLVRWSREKFTDSYPVHAEERLAAKHPNVDRTVIEEAVRAMNWNCLLESGGR